nr:MAG TPA: hypothetical protein [Caudoviricetes sp.]
MNYEFHVGDYVKTRAGFIGYIDNISDLENDNIAVRVCYSDGASGIFKVNDLNITNNFVRIGAYDFTKKEKKKIENLVKPQWDIPVEDLIDKINELVDAVNKLMDKEDDR